MQDEQFQKLLEASERREKLLQQQMELQNRQMQELMSRLTVTSATDGTPQLAITPQSTSDISRQVKDIADRMVLFEYDPERELTFETWFDRYESIFTSEAANLSEPVKVSLLLQKFSQTDYQKFANDIMPRKPTDMKLE